MEVFGIIERSSTKGSSWVFTEGFTPGWVPVTATPSYHTDILPWVTIRSVRADQTSPHRSGGVGTPAAVASLDATGTKHPIVVPLDAKLLRHGEILPSRKPVAQTYLQLGSDTPSGEEIVFAFFYWQLERRVVDVDKPSFRGIDRSQAFVEAYQSRLHHLWLEGVFLCFDDFFRWVIAVFLDFSFSPVNI